MAEADPLEIADRLFRAIEAGDLAGVGELYAPDVEIWHNHDGVIQTAEENLRTLGWVARNLSNRRYDEIRRSATADGFIQQHVLRAVNRAGDEVALAACIVVRLHDGWITRLDEYLDSAQAAAFNAKGRPATSP